MRPTRYRLRQPRCDAVHYKSLPPAGLEPATFGLEVQRAIHCAKGAFGKVEFFIKLILLQLFNAPTGARTLDI